MKKGITNSRSEKYSAGLQILRSGFSNWLLQNKTIRLFFFAVAIMGGATKSTAQIANYVSNGSFEELYNCSAPNYLFNVKYWMSIDSSTTWSGIHLSICNGAVPNQANTEFQYPRSGNTFILTNFYCAPSLCPYNQRGYLKNRLKQQLQAGNIYCVKFYVNIANTSTYGIDQFSAYFSDASIDTITKCTFPLTYLNPQVNNPIGNIVVDTLGWVEVSGTFTATGNEKYCVIGNFKSNVATNTATANPQYLPMQFTDLCIDDVSCIPLDLPAYAYVSNDVYAIPGNTLYLGRQRDVGIDEACMWYKLPNTSAAIDTAAGITITVAATTETYMVKQEICGVIKYDTVIVHASALGFNEQENNVYTFSIFPNPASETIFLSSNTSLDGALVKISDVTGKVLIVKILDSSANLTELPLNLIEGMYFVSVKKNNETANFKLFVAK